MGKHAIIVVKNEKGEYLQYFDKNWGSYLFLNCKMENKDDIKSISQFLEKDINIKSENITYLFRGEKTHKKYSESAKIEKEYTHYFYEINLIDKLEMSNDEFEILDKKYKWFSYDELKNDVRIQEVNSDIVNYIKEFGL